MKAHSSKYLNAVHTSMALATVGLQGLLPHSAKDACNYHSTHIWEGLTGGSLHHGNRKGSPNSQPYLQLTKPHYLKQSQHFMMPK